MPKFFDSRPGGARIPSAPLGYAYGEFNCLLMYGMGCRRFVRTLKI